MYYPNRQAYSQYQQSFRRPQLEQHTDPKSKKRTITVTGTSTISVEPNTVTIQLAVITEDESLAIAQQENANKMNNVIQSIENLGVPATNIQTSAININPQYDFIDGQQLFRGYEVSNEITVTIDTIDKTGNIIDTAVRNGVNRVSTIRFTIDDEHAYYEQALTNALQNALQKAQAIALSMNLPLDQTPIKITEELMDSHVTYKTFAATTDSFTTPIEPGQISITANIRTIFKY
ncbi:SIMPL domain-containing protein [Oceanobacillus bengalensis]